MRACNFVLLIISGAVRFVGAVRTIGRAVAQLVETDAGAVRNAQQLTEQALVRDGSDLRRVVVAARQRLFVDGRN